MQIKNYCLKCPRTCHNGSIGLDRDESPGAGKDIVQRCGRVFGKQSTFVLRLARQFFRIGPIDFSILKKKFFLMLGY